VKGTSKERRREPRVSASGNVELYLDGQTSKQVRGRLLDISSHGFRAAHTCSSLTPGQEVRFQHHDGGGSARVMWIRVLSTRVETGFLLL
jgi:hypothetical protein